MHLAAGILIALLASQSGQKPEWCRDLPRPAYSKLERVNVPDKWFEVYRIRPGLFAIYEPHQQEEIISYLIVGQKQALLKAPFPEEARCPLFGLRCLRVLLFLLLHHDVKLFLLVIVQRAAHLGDGAFADGVDLLDLVVARHGAVLHHVHGLGVLIFQSGLDLGLLVGGKIQLLRQGLHLIVNAGATGGRWALRLSCRSGLLARLRVLVL